MKLENLLKRKRSFRRLVGISVDNFFKIEEKVSKLRKQEIERRVTHGDHPKLSVREHILLTLLYYRTNITHFTFGILLEVADSTITRSIARIEPLISKVVDIDKSKNIEMSEFENVIVDCTEQQIERPKTGQTKYYSGKKKRHTIKTQIITNSKGKILSVSKHYPGAVHDYPILKKNQKLLSKSKKVLADKGYQGLNKVMKSAQIPKKNFKSNPLSEEDHQRNKRISKERIYVEHAFARIKKFKIMSDPYRCKLGNYSTRFAIIASISNLT